MSLLCQLSFSGVPFWNPELNKGRWQAPMTLPYLGDEHIHQALTTRECLMGYMRPHT